MSTMTPTTAPQVSIVQVQGSIRGTTCIRFQELLKSLCATPIDSILVIDLQQIETIDAQGLGALVTGLRAAQQTNKRLILCSLSTEVRAAFEQTQLNQVFEIYANRDVFLKAIASIDPQVKVRLAHWNSTKLAA